MRIGLRAHDLQCNNFNSLVKELNQLDIKAIQLAIPKVINNFFDYSLIERKKLIKEASDIFRDNNITINVLGCYINPSDRDTISLNKQIDRFYENIEYAKILNAQVIGTETGSFNQDGSYNPLNHEKECYLYVIETINKLVTRGEKIGVNIGVEGVWQFVIYDPNAILNMIHDIDSDRLKIIFDGVNLLCYNNINNAFDIFGDSFDKYGDKISVAHLKDYKVSNNSLSYGVPYSGEFEVGKYLRFVKSKNDALDVIVEETNPNNVKEIINKLRGEI